ncbi:hypothetical protein H0B56_01280 [Haloechinothrix sp. YIM 98757]|uniref:SEC-C motif-containing protein n=1 Tax=Haloechinothrix aidingensis TaxID=2752311 RepID=A0A838A3P1_9PSEU|nr:SEC-C domain-containing protein [Haloechinothrix aidingensis]MBA0124170.1 hypothetical protein [Haloechinothrix aidingensis]
MPSTNLVSEDELDALGAEALRADDPGPILTELLDIIERGRLADPASEGYALELAAEISQWQGDLDTALELVERALSGARASGEQQGYPRALRAEILVQLGREDEGMSELDALRPLLVTDPSAVDYLSDTLEACDRAELAEQWLTEAMWVVLARCQDGDGTDEAGEESADAAVLAALARHRHALRRELDLEPDELDEVAEELADDADDADDSGEVEEPELYGLDSLDSDEFTLVYWPRAEFDRLTEEWPELATVTGPSWDDHRMWTERALTAYAEQGVRHLHLVAGSAADVLAFVAERDAADDLELVDEYGELLAEQEGGTRWPPERDDDCWCGSASRYEDCCLLRSRVE